MRKRGKIIKPVKAAVLALIMFLIFYFVGEAFLKLFGVDTPSFAVAGSLIIFVMACEMILDISIFKDTTDTPKDSSFFPVVFPLIAGAGALTTLLSIRAQYADINVLLAIFVNILVIYIVVKAAKVIEKKLGQGGIYVMKKCFGIILLAISVKIFITNIAILIDQISKAS
jgi:multiple antibiotic resistance protein